MERQSAVLDKRVDPPGISAAPGGKRRFIVDELPLTSHQDGRDD